MRRLFPVLLLAACAASPDGVVAVDGALPDDALGPPLASGFLELGVSTLDVGETISFTVRGAYAGEQVTIWRGTGYGSGACLPSLGGRCLAVTGHQVLFTRTANQQGEVHVSATVPGLPLGQDVFFQAGVEGGTPATSGVESRRVRAFGTTSPYRVGPAHPQNAQGSISPNAIIFQTVELAEDTPIIGLTFRATRAGPRFKGAVYTDNQGRPDRLVAQTDPTPVTNGLASGPNVMTRQTLPAGRYWAAVVFDTDVDTLHDTLVTEPEWITLQPFSQAFPATWSGGNAYQSIGVALSVGVR